MAGMTLLANAPVPDGELAAQLRTDLGDAGRTYEMRGAFELLFEFEGVGVVAQVADADMRLSIWTVAHVVDRSRRAKRLSELLGLHPVPALIATCQEDDLDPLLDHYLRIARRLGELRAGGWQLAHSSTFAPFTGRWRPTVRDCSVESLAIINPLTDHVSYQLSAGVLSARRRSQRLIRRLERDASALESMPDVPVVLRRATGVVPRRERLRQRNEQLSPLAAELRRRARIAQRMRERLDLPVETLIADVDRALKQPAASTSRGSENSTEINV